MTTVEMGREAAGRRAYLRLSDAMAEANGQDRDDGGDGGAALQEYRVATRLCQGIRYQRCGGGRRVIRRSNGRAY